MDTLIIYTIYNSPFDFPGDFVVKKWECSGHAGEPVQDPSFVKLSKTLEGARAYLPHGSYNLGHEKTDDPAIVESWI